MYLNSTNQVSAGTVIFEEGKSDRCIFMVLKGKVRLSGDGTCIIMGAGSLLGLEQLSGRHYPYTCTVLEDASIYAVSADSEKGVSGLLAANKDYSGITVYNHARLLAELSKQREKLYSCTEKIYRDLKEFNEVYMGMAGDNKCKTTVIPKTASLEEFSGQLEYAQDIDLLMEYSKIPYDAVKNFYAGSPRLAIDEMFRMVRCENALSEACAEAADYIDEAYTALAGNSAKSVYRNMLGLAIDLKKKGVDTDILNDMIEACRTYTAEVKELIGPQTSREWKVDEEALDGMYQAYRNGEDFRDESDGAGAAVESNIANAVNSLNDLLGQLSQYGEYPEEKTAAFSELIDRFAALSDKTSTEEDVRKLRKAISESYYGLYRCVALRAVREKDIPLPVSLFLDYGLVSEKLITQDELVQLLSLKRTDLSEPCRVYTMYEWLKEIFEERQEPSRNDLGQDYSEALREMRKSGQITPDEEKELLTDPVKKVQYEIDNVLLSGSRVVSGQLSIFVPMLYSDQITNDLDRGFMSSKRINYTVEDITSIDFSVFYREALFVDEEQGIDREYEMRNVPPVFIIFPIVGENVIMWQEITGRKRDSEGRFFAPAFAFGGFNEAMIRAFGNFRWSLCKTIQGVNWNNIQVRSLTSEYSDYIQFYKKNHELSDERKEKIKLQIQRGRNNLRQVFTLDYEVWIKAESTGSVRLNKVVRDILAMYCPFSADIRNSVVKQPLFEEAFARSTRERGKKVHELELRHKALEAKGIEVPEPLRKTLEFYRDM